MNKKFSTLMASLLLAGGAFSNAWATDINTLANTGKYYKIVRTGYKAADGWKSEKTSSYYLGENALVEGVANADFWRVEKASNGTVTLVNFSGKTLQVNKKNVSISTIRYNDTDLAKEENPVETNLFVTADNKYLGNTDKNGTSWPLVLTDTKSVSNSSSINAWDAVDAGNTGDVLGFRTELGAGAIDAIRFIYNNNGIYPTTDIYQVAYDKTTETYSFKHNQTGDEVVAGSVKSFKLYQSDLHGAYLKDASGSKYVKLTITNGEIESAELVDNEVEATYLGFETVSDVWVPVSALNILEKDGFSVTIYYDEKTDGVHSNHLNAGIAGNPFKGHLTTMIWNKTDKKFEPVTSGDIFYLKNEAGDYIVAQKYKGQGSEPAEALYGFTTVKEADLKHYLIRRDADPSLEVETEYFGLFAAQVDGVDFDADPSALTKVDALTYLKVCVDEADWNWAMVARYDFTNNNVTTPTLVASEKTSLYPIYISLGDRQIVDWKEFLQDKFFTIEKVTKDAKDNGYLVPESNDETRFEKTYSNVLEGQWALTADVKDGKAYSYTFTNRENENVIFSFENAQALYCKSGAENTYKYLGDEYVIKAVNTDPSDGYKVLATDKELNQKWNIAFASSVFDGKAYLTENHSDAKDAAYHVIGLTTDVEKALEFSVKKYDGKYEKKENTTSHIYEYYPADTIYVVSTLGYYNTKTKDYDTKLDTLKVLAYSFVNQWNEPLAYGDVNANGDLGYKSLVKFDLTEDGKKVTYEASKTDLTKSHEAAQKFAIRLDGDNGNYNLRPVEFSRFMQKETSLSSTWKDEMYQIFDNKEEEGDLVKMYAGDASIGIMDNVALYDRTENDLFTIEGVDSDIYRRLANNVDTVSIYRNYNEKSLLYEKTTEISDDVFVNFLGMENIADFTKMAPAMIADTAYVRNETYKPQYMLIVDPTIHPAGKWCDVCNSDDCEHAVDVPAWTEGRILVNLVDSAKAWDEANKHQVGNPYKNTEGYYKLGFVQATHRKDSLIVNGKRQFIGNNDNHIAKFQFRYADTEDKSFVIETSLDGTQTPGYLKWMNGVVVVVDDIKNADIYNMNEDESRTPTANETIATGNVVVAGVDGAVVVKGAEGKNVIVSTILGKVVANEVVSSDNATIAAPAGVVVVSVDGESFKVVVK